jgi:hypothetical protein
MTRCVRITCVPTYGSRIASLWLAGRIDLRSVHATRIVAEVAPVSALARHALPVSVQLLDQVPGLLDLGCGVLSVWCQVWRAAFAKASASAFSPASAWSSAALNLVLPALYVSPERSWNAIACW